jgi:hypothetical protein
MNTKKGISIYFPFRSFHNQAINYKVILAFLIPPIFNWITLFFLDEITQFWSFVLQFFLNKFSFDATIQYTQYYIFNTFFSIPHISMPADFPDGITWWYALFFTSMLFWVTFLISEKYTPIIYFLRTIVVVICCSLIFSLVYANGFPYTISQYTKSGFLQIISILFGLPWIYALTYYLFSYQYIDKIIVTSLVILYFILLAPFQYLLNACLIHIYSLILMPILYIYSGLLLNIFSAVAFFAYGLSLEGFKPKYTQSNRI